MKEKHILSVFGQVNEEYIEQAASTIGKPQKPQKQTWVKWATMAACLCLVVVGALTTPNWLNNPQHGQGSTSKAPTVIFNDVEYTICGTSGEAAILQECGLPTELSTDLAGTFVAYLDYDGECYYTVTDKETDILMFEYKPEPNTNVYVVIIDETYYVAIRRDSKGFHGINGNNMAVPGGNPNAYETQQGNEIESTQPAQTDD